MDFKNLDAEVKELLDKDPLLKELLYALKTKKEERRSLKTEKTKSGICYVVYTYKCNLCGASYKQPSTYEKRVPRLAEIRFWASKITIDVSHCKSCREYLSKLSKEELIDIILERKKDIELCPVPSVKDAPLSDFPELAPAVINKSII